MTTLVIHPKDKTTDFMLESYAGTDYSLMNTSCSNSALKRLIKDHDRIVMIGHGGDIGMLGFSRLLITSQLVYLLREKKDTVYIWCNADKFVRQYGMKGFATGMIISDWEEAMLYCVTATDEEIDESNRLFATAVKQSLMLPPKEMREKMLEVYNLENPVVYFNRQNLFLIE